MLIGKRIYGRYRIIEMIGGGGMANVYLAEDMILEREVAIKILRMDFSNDEEFIKRFNREAQSATSLAHPNVVSIYDVGEEDHIYFIVMEYVSGMTLKQYIQTHPNIPVEKAVSIMRQITEGMSHAHQHGIIHRDIKPQNILIDENEHVKITDFGIATALSATSITQTNAVLGSVHYLSPEQARGGMANKKSDIYSMGIVMFELLTGRLPFSGESAVSIALKHLQSTTPSPRRWNPSIPQSVENIILKATAKDPFHRYENADEMKEDLETALLPYRKNEQPFAIPEDMDATKAIPVIAEDRHEPEMDDTIIMLPVHGDTMKNHLAEEKGPEQSAKKQKKPKKKKDKPKKKERKPKKRLFTTLIVTIITLIVLGILAITVLPKLLEPAEVKIPNVQGKDFDDAYVDLLNKGFKIGKTRKMENDKIEENKVIGTRPKIGATVKEGSSIDIFVSKGKKKIELSDFRDRQYEDVKTLLEGFGFKDIEIEEVYDDNTEAGAIMEQSPLSGTKLIPSETVLKLKVSKGKEKVTVQNLLNYTQAELDQYESESGLQIVQKEVSSDTVPEGRVVSQYPSAFAKVDKYSKVHVDISKGKEEPPPKPVVKEVTIPYEPLVPGQPQEVQIYIQDLNHTMTEPYRTESITETKKIPLEFTVEPNRKAGFKVMRDRKVILEEEIPYPAE
ncbi:Stk1 family PASTA domain-containing Ser/Thr kinase [Bacillus testis]|uniref:Stk1 family PASTA domain-containing Ser/Thr kinase n=1 Tax=Bacillus testis TaxID=1622072 RepID=UPI00067F69E3|nr:Stk1 family PASTA domain-containing Ser/Thr kinase [Bacillus testis]